MFSRWENWRRLYRDSICVGPWQQEELQWVAFQVLGNLQEWAGRERDICMNLWNYSHAVVLRAPSTQSPLSPTDFGTNDKTKEWQMEPPILPFLPIKVKPESRQEFGKPANRTLG